jgi:hypothetical protein
MDDRVAVLQSRRRALRAYDVESKISAGPSDCAHGVREKDALDLAAQSK